MDFRPYTCCFIGHRDIPRCDEEKIITRVRYQVERMAAGSIKYFGVGGDVGFDMIVAEYLISLRDYYHQDIKIISVLPYPEWREKWTAEKIRRQDRIMNRSDKVVYANQEYCPDVHQLLDRKLVDGSAHCISYCNRLTGETADSIRYAMRKGLQVFNASSWDVYQLLER